MTVVVCIKTRNKIYLPDDCDYSRKPREKTKEEKAREQKNNQILAELKIVPGSGKNKAKY